MKINKKFLLLIVIAFVFLIFLLFVSFFDNRMEVSFLVIYSLSYFIITSFFFLLKKEKNIVDIKTIYIVVFSLMIGISPLFYGFNHLKLLSNDSFIVQSLLILTGYFFFCLTCLFGKEKNKYKNYNIKRELAYSKFFGWSLVLISSFAHIMYVVKNISIIASSDAAVSFSSISGNGFILQIINLFIIGFGLLYFYYLNNEKKNKLLYVFLIINCLCYVIRGTRTPVVYLLIYMILLRHAFKPLPFKQFFKVFIIIFCLVGVLGVFRSIMHNNRNDFYDTIVNELQVGSINFNYIYRTFPSKTNFQYGKSLLINFYMLKPGPDDDSTMWLKKQIGLNFSGGGVTPTLIGEGYLNFGVFGVILFSIIAALIVNTLNYSYFGASKKNIVWISYIIMKLVDVFRCGFSNSEISLMVLLFIFVVYRLGYKILESKLVNDDEI